MGPQIAPSLLTGMKHLRFCRLSAELVDEHHRAGIVWQLGETASDCFGNFRRDHGHIMRKSRSIYSRWYVGCSIGYDFRHSCFHNSIHYDRSQGSDLLGPVLAFFKVSTTPDGSDGKSASSGTVENGLLESQLGRDTLCLKFSIFGIILNECFVVTVESKIIGPARSFQNLVLVPMVMTLDQDAQAIPWERGYTLTTCSRLTP